jgi:nucleoside-diphosphate-sugar epimerase
MRVYLLLLLLLVATPYDANAGTDVVSLFSHKQRRQIESVGGFLVKGDVFDPKSVKKALNLVEEYDAVVSTVGGTPADPKADSEGNIALIDACVAKGIKKFVLVTSIGTGDSKSAPPQNVYDALEPVLIEKEKAEEHLKKVAKEKGIDFVIVRPGGLKSEPRTNTAVLTENTNVCGAIHREDVAALTMMCVLKDKANGKTLSAVDKAQLFDQPEFEVFEVGDGPLSPTQEATENALK